VRRIEISGSRETNPFWSHDSLTLAFTTSISGRNGTYKVTIPDKLNPEFMNARTGTGARWIKTGSKILWLSDGVPYAYTEGYPFKVYQETDLVAYRRLGFRRIWRELRDSFYDDTFHGRDWDAMLHKYEDAAATAPDAAAFGRVVAMLQGELNASHTGFQIADNHWDPWKASDNWTAQTAHLGVRFDPTHPGPGWRVRDVIRDGPADREQTRLWPGDLILRIDGVPVEAQAPRARSLTGRIDRVIRLRVAAADGAERDVVLRPIDYDRARALLWEQWIEENRRRVEERSGGSLGYVHVDKMNWDTFYRFEQEIFSVGYEKEGLIIDVRNNGGGFTADHLLTILCRPQTAVTIPRGGEESYPRGYLAHLSWDKPIVVLCNQYTASNGEIFSHAIKGLGRGRLVGVPTQGSVISTPNARILELGTLNLPRRAWFTLADGEDMEGNGAVPDILIWPQPGDIPAGRDAQLAAATDALLEDVAAYLHRDRPRLRYAREREDE
jgi:tricorn protease